MEISRLPVVDDTRPLDVLQSVGDICSTEHQAIAASRADIADAIAVLFFKAVVRRKSDALLRAAEGVDDTLTIVTIRWRMATGTDGTIDLAFRKSVEGTTYCMSRRCGDGSAGFHFLDYEFDVVGTILCEPGVDGSLKT